MAAADRLASRRDHAFERSEKRAELFLPVGNQVANMDLLGYEEDGEDDTGLKLVEEIKSLCMRCEKNVCSI